MEASPELDAVVRRIMRSSFVDQDATAVWNAARGTDEGPPGRLVTASEVWDRSTIDPDTSKLITKRAGEIGIKEIEVPTLESFQHGEMGWFFGEVVFLGDVGEISRQRVTGVLVIEKGVWRVLQWHMSIAVSPLESYGVQLSTDLGALVDSLGPIAGDAIGAASRSGTVTLLFTDLVDSTHVAETLGDDGWASLIANHLSSVADTVARHRGTLVKTLGDGAMAAFASVSDAMYCALELRQGSEDGIPIRIGLHTGDAIHENGDYVGITVNKAARVTATARPAEVLLSSVTAEMALGRGFKLGESRTVELKGLQGNHTLTILIAGPPTAS
jgi:class 3 adenylate cyclase